MQATTCKTSKTTRRLTRLLNQIDNAMVKVRNEPGTGDNKDAREAKRRACTHITNARQAFIEYVQSLGYSLELTPQNTWEVQL